MYGDLRFSVRSLARTPGFTSAVVLTLALGLGGNAAVFSVVDAVLIRPLPYPEPQDLVAIAYSGKGPVSSGSQIPSPLFLALSEESRTLQGIAAYNIGSVTWLTNNREQIRVLGARLSPNLFFLLGAARPAFGRQLNAQDGVVEAPRVALLSHSFWRARFGGDRSILEHSLTLDGRSYQIVGVVAEGFRFPGRDTPDVFLPIQLPVNESSVRFLNAVGRVVEGGDIDQVQQEATLVDRRLSVSYPSSLQPLVEDGVAPRVLPLQEHIAGDLRDTLLLILGVAASVLFLACVNVASLLLARLNARANDFTSRFAVGATPFQLARQALVEATVLSTLGAIAALATVWVSMEGIRELLTGNIPHSDTVSLDLRSLVVLGTASAVAGMLCASYPLLALSRWHTRVAAWSGRRSMGSRYRDFLVAAQVGVSVTLLVGSLLLTKSLANLTGVNLGFDPNSVLSFRMPAARGTQAERGAGVREVLRRTRGLPGVLAAGATTALPLEGRSFEFAISVNGNAKPPPGAPLTAVDVASPDYFRALGATLETGRGFDHWDIDGAAPVAVVNEAFAELRLAGRDPLGSRLSLGGDPEDADILVVGVVRDVQNEGPRDNVLPHVYRPFSQAAPQLGWHTLVAIVRTKAEPLAMVRSVRSEIAQIGGWGVMYDVRTLDQRLSSLVAPDRLRASLTSLFALVAVVLAGIGVLSLVSYTVARQLREFGVRRALGCQRFQLLILAMGRGLVPASVGIALGLAGSVSLSGFLTGFLYGTSSSDAATLSLAAVIVLSVAAVASYGPARRASEVDPVRILKNE